MIVERMAFPWLDMSPTAYGWKSFRRQGDLLLVEGFYALHWYDLRTLTMVAMAYISKHGGGHSVHRPGRYQYLKGFAFPVATRWVRDVYQNVGQDEPVAAEVSTVSVRLEKEPDTDFAFPAFKGATTPGRYKQLGWIYVIDERKPKVKGGPAILTGELKGSPPHGTPRNPDRSKAVETKWGTLRYIETPTKRGWFLVAPKLGPKWPKEETQP